MSTNFRKTKYGIAICPFFTWTSENIGSEDKTPKENDVNLVHCTNMDNPDLYEGNCTKENCPLVEI